jgi:hypothetical protein
MREQRNESIPIKAWVIGALSWLVPGAGHLLQKKWWRGSTLCLVVTGMFALGIAFNGQLSSLSTQEQGVSVLLQALKFFANVGNGILYLICSIMGVGFSAAPEVAKNPTFEYGNTFMLVSGLLNYLVALDAFDIYVGRKL